MRVTRLSVLVLLTLAALAGCSSSTNRATPTTTGAATRPVAVYAKPGPYAAGVTTLTIGDRQADVWYPVAKSDTAGKVHDVYEIAKWLPQGLQDLVASKGVKAPFATDAFRDVRVSTKGPFPTVVFAHGFGGYRDQSTFLTTHLASWGFVVASPDFLERGLGAQLGAPPAAPRTEDDVIGATLDALRSENAKSGSVLAGSVDPKAKIAITGHSAGGRTAITYGANSDIITYIPLAAAAGAFRDQPAATPPQGKSSLYIAGANDTVIPPDGIESFFRTVPPPKRMVVIDRVGHLNAMSDICEIGAGGGGVVKLAQDAGLPVPDTLAKLGTDGCFAPNYESTKVWPITRHFEVAQLRWAFGIDPKPVGLQPSIVKAFLPITVTYTMSLGT
ncbi:MAG: dienelactone hydrolase family protein [Acidimicrobiia bacterium]|nr:dienelactone hydrolase family protein [Acidimicrobiia bacterium]